MTPRARQVVQLLGTLQDVEPAPDTWTGRMLERSTKRGPAPSRWRTCTDCQGAGRVFDKFKRVAVCVTCGGQGRFKVDDYTSERVSTAAAYLVRHDTVRCDRCDGHGVWKFSRCTLCDGSGRRPVTRAHGDGDGGSAGRADRSLNLWGHDGSYHELDAALHHLHGFAPRTYRVVWSVHVTRARAREAVPPEESWAMGQGVEWIAVRMPVRILVPAWARTSTVGVPRGRWANGHQLDKRDKEIRRLHREGKAGQWIAREMGLTPARVSQVVRGSAD